MALEIRVAEPQQWAEIGALIYDSTNAWYLKNRGFSVYNCTKEDAKIYCQIYDDLDAANGGCCFIAFFICCRNDTSTSVFRFSERAGHPFKDALFFCIYCAKS